MNIDLKLLTNFRKELHANPELSEHEKNTSERILAQISKTKPDELLTQVGGYGIIATWKSEKAGPHVLFRADMDALPIEEENTFDYMSKNKGVSHKCGHDGHSTILCGVADFISQNKPESGKISLLWQPAEENGEGAKAILEDPKFKNIKPDFVFALHNLPGYPLHEVVCKEDVFTAAVNSIIISLKGKTSHAAEPEHGINPALALAKILEESILMDYNKPEKSDMRVVTPVFLEMGKKAYGISAGNAEIHLTLRCWNNDNLRKLEIDIEDLATSIANKHNLKVNFEYTQTFHSNINNPEALEFVKNACRINKLNLTEREYPFKWGEDFGLFTTKFKGCMFGLGSGENSPALHNPDYDFPDEILLTGIQMFTSIYTEICKKSLTQSA